MDFGKSNREKEVISVRIAKLSKKITNKIDLNYVQ